MSDLSHAFPFDPNYGYTIDALRAIMPPPEPADIEPFWQATRAQTLAVPLRVDMSDLESPHADFRLRLVRFNGFGQVRLGAWLTEPADGAIDRFAVVGHGYYNRPVEDIQYSPGTASLNFACRGLGISRQHDISDQTMFHVLHGIEAKETYVHRGCVADIWSAASAMLDLFPQAAGRLEYYGESFGGGTGAMALAWDDRFAFARIRIPSFGHHPIRLRCRCTGAGEAVRRKWERAPEIYDNTLRYFDAAAMAHRVTTPTHYACAIFDPAVPPPGQFAIHNATTAPKSLSVWRTGHYDWPGHAADVQRAADDANAMRRSFGISLG